MTKRHDYGTTEEWLKMRAEMNDRLGGSELGVAANHSGYDSAYSLFCKKTGVVPERDISLNEPIVQGHDCEDVVAQRFARMTGKGVVEEKCIFTNDRYPHLKATPDRMIVGEDSGLECKTAQKESWRRNKEGDFPLTYFDQCCCYMAVTEKRRWYLSAMVYGNAFRTFLMTREKGEADRYAELKGLFYGVTDEEGRKRFLLPLKERVEYFEATAEGIAASPEGAPLYGRADDFREWIEKWCWLEAVYFVDEETLDACEKVAATFIGRCKAVEEFMAGQSFDSDTARRAALSAAVVQVWPQDEIDSSEATAEVLAMQYPEAEEGTAVALDGACIVTSDGTPGKTYAELLADRKRCKEEIDRLEDEVASIENVLAMKIGEKERATLDGWSILYKNASYRSLDKEALAAEFGGKIPDRLYTESSSRRWYIREKKAKKA